MEKLVIELVHEIFTNLDPKDLLACRLVNREWNYVSCKYLKLGSKAIQIRTNAHLQKFITTMEINTQDFPFSKIHMNISNLIKENVELFATTFGSQIAEYDFDLDFSGSTSTKCYYEAVEKVGILLKYSPDVEILRIKDENIEMDFSKFEFELYFPCVLPRLHVLEISVDQLLRQSLGTKVHFGLLYKLVLISPTLQHFIIHFIGNGFWNSQLSNLLIAMQNVPRISLVNLSIRTEDVRRGNIQSLVAIKCQIQELSLVIMDSVLNPQLLLRLLYDWLEIDGQTLTKLQLKTDNVGFCLPSLNNLIILELNLSKKLDKEKELSFLQRFQPEQFPRLTSVHLTQYSENYLYFSSGIFPKVTNLTLDTYHEEIIRERWDYSFPNLKFLTLLNANPHHLNFVFDHLNYIRSLHIAFNPEKTNDSEIQRILIGASTVNEFFRHIENSTVSDRINGYVEEYNQLILPHRLSFLGSMKNLQSLEIRICGSGTLNALLLISCNGLLRRLGNLQIITSSDTEIEVQLGSSEILSGFHDRVVIKNNSN